MIAASKLRGMPLYRAELYGKPHVGAAYTGSTPRAYERMSAWCAICGRPATCCHHLAPLRSGGRFDLVTDCGTWRLRSALIALCGSGTTGCHDGFHGGARFRARWAWDSAEFEEAWWRGELLAMHGEHDPALYGYGRWIIEDANGRSITIREEN